MKDNIIYNDFKDIFSKDVIDEFLFPIDNYWMFLEGLSIDPSCFFHTWKENRQYLIDKFCKQNTKQDWKWSLSFPFFSLLEKYIENFDHPIIIGFSGLPGSGKSTLGSWINNLATELDLDIKVISLDDFYLPGDDMDIAMNGNPWNVPRGYPGSHSIDLLNQTLETYLKTGFLKSPVFDKSLREGKGDRSGWLEFKPKVLVLEGWFVGCEPIPDLHGIDYIYEDEFNLCLSQIEKKFRVSIQQSLSKYSKIWNKFDKIWHLKSSEFNNTIFWKIQQENEMIKLKGSGLKDNKLRNFIRMIKSSIPQQSFSLIKADTTIVINQNRRISKLSTNTYLF